MFAPWWEESAGRSFQGAAGHMLEQPTILPHPPTNTSAPNSKSLLNGDFTLPSVLSGPLDPQTSPPVTPRTCSSLALGIGGGARVGAVAGNLDDFLMQMLTFYRDALQWPSGRAHHSPYTDNIQMRTRQGNQYLQCFGYNCLFGGYVKAMTH